MFWENSSDADSYKIISIEDSEYFGKEPPYIARWDVLTKGFLEFQSFYGSDDVIVQSGRTSVNGHSKGKKSDARLQERFGEDGAVSVTEHCGMKFRVKLPLYVFAQWVRHWSQHFSQESFRYVEAEDDDVYIPGGEEWRIQDKVNKQGSAGLLPAATGLRLTEMSKDLTEWQYRVYHYMLECGVAREQARGVLPVSKYTTVVVTASIRDWMFFLKQRNNEHAQKEIRDYAVLIELCLKEAFPRQHDIYTRIIAPDWRRMYLELKSKLDNNLPLDE